MTLIEAIKSGRPFRRKNSWGETPWRNAKDGAFIADELLADDWEIQEPTVTISRALLFEALGEIDVTKLTEFHPPSGNTYLSWKAIDDFARRLGLGGPE